MISLLGLEFNLVKLSEEDKSIYNEYNKAKENKDYEKSDELRKVFIERKIL